MVKTGAGDDSSCDQSLCLEGLAWDVNSSNFMHNMYVHKYVYIYIL